MAYSPIEDKYLSVLTSQQFPDMPAEPVATEPSVDGVQLAEVGATKMGDYGYSGQRQPTMTDYDPTVRERMADFLQAGFEKFGMDRYKARQNAQTLIGGPSSNLPMNIGIADIVPFLGTGLQTQEAARMGGEAVTSAQQGNIGTAAMQAGGAAVGMIPGVAGTVKAGKALAPKAGEMVLDTMTKLGTPVKMDLMAYHGSPHKVDRFDASKIGTGEGNQSYGYGLYFAESPDVAKSYMAVNPSVLPSPIRAFQGKELEPGSPEYHAATLLSRNGMTLQKARSEVKGWIAESQGDERMANVIDGWKKTLETLNQAKSKSDFKELKNKGNFYTVDIPDDMVAKMLDFEQPINKQSAEIQALAKELGLSGDDLGGDLLAAARGKTASGAKMMRESGIPGVRYLDQGSRGVGTGTKNIVVFPGGENEVQIMKHEGNK